MEVPVESHGKIVYSVLINVTRDEHQYILQHKWYKLKGQPFSRKLGYLFRIVKNMRVCNGENLFRNLVPVEYSGVVVTYAKVDEDDILDLKRHKWVLTNEGYAQFWNPIIRTNISMHRYLMNFPKNLVVDHLTWNRLDNRKSQLRICTQSENCKNGTNGLMFGKQTRSNTKDGPSGERGV